MTGIASVPGGEEIEEAALPAAPSAVTVLASRPAKTSSYAWYVAGMLSLAQMVSIMDRYLLGVVLENVKRDLVLSDTELGILLGPSFVLLFTIASLPFGRLADIGNRRLLISGALLLWSFATAACGLANSFAELMLARLLVGLGEAALLPAAMSLIAAYFSKDKFHRGVSIYTVGGSLGRAAGFIGGGAALAYLSASGAWALPFMGASRPWQGVFLGAGGLGIFAAALFYLTVKEPPRARAARKSNDFRSGLAHFWRQRWAYLAIFVPFSMAAALTYQLTSWTVSFYVREHDLSVPVASTIIGTTSLVCGPIGHLGGGWLNDRLGIRGVMGVQPLLLAGLLILGPLGIILFALAPSVPLAAIFFAIGYTIIAAAGPTGYGGSQAPTPDAYRGVISAIFLIFFTILGTGLGPMLVALIGDYILQNEGQIGLAIIASTLIFAAAGLPFALLGRRAYHNASESLHR